MKSVTLTLHKHLFRFINWVFNSTSTQKGHFVPTVNCREGGWGGEGNWLWRLRMANNVRHGG